MFEKSAFFNAESANIFNIQPISNPTQKKQYIHGKMENVLNTIYCKY